MEIPIYGGARLLGKSRGTTLGAAHRMFVSYPSDLVEFTASWNRTSTNFNSEVGFLRRGGFQRFASELAFSPRPGRDPNSR